MTDEEKDDMRREVTRQIGALQRQLNEREADLASSARMSHYKRVITSCNVAALQTELRLLHQALIDDSPEPGGMSPFSINESGYVQGHGNVPDPSELGSAHLVKALRETRWLPAMSLPWSWNFDRVKGSLLQRGYAVANGRYMLVDGYVAPSMMAYLARAGALFPGLVREVIALRIAALTASDKGPGIHPAYGEADALINGTVRGGTESPAQSGSSG